jgi:hypothetical protein
MGNSGGSYRKKRRVGRSPHAPRCPAHWENAGYGSLSKRRTKEPLPSSRRHAQLLDEVMPKPAKGFALYLLS